MRSRTPRRLDRNTVAQFAYELRTTKLSGNDQRTALLTLIDVLEPDDNMLDVNKYYRRGYLANLGEGILLHLQYVSETDVRRVMKCGHCGEADNTQGEHGINHCVTL